MATSLDLRRAPVENSMKGSFTKGSFIVVNLARAGSTA